MAQPLTPLPLQDQRGRHVDAFQEWMTTNVLHAVADSDIDEPLEFVPIHDARAYLAYQDHARLDEILFELYRPHVPPTDAPTILSKYVAVFCILVEIEHGAAISEFVNRDWNDHQLPCGESYSRFPSYGPEFHKRFCEVQWKYCVPDFNRNMHRDFDEKRILPIAKKRKLHEQGGDATVYEVGIHSFYNKLQLDGLSTASVDDPLRNTFALKKYTLDTLPSYNSEVEAFRRLHQTANPHLIGFYGNYTQGGPSGSYNILLEWADRGSLENYFAQISPPSEEGDIINFWTSLFGIFKALHGIHECRSNASNAKIMNGWHQDVKPKNILVVSNGAASPYTFRFKLADFGVTHFHTSLDDGGSSTAADAFGTQTYGAPECFRSDVFWDQSTLRVKQRADIWSFGCVLSEAAVWVGRGYEGVLKYRDARSMATEPISKRLGDAFHNGQHALLIVSEWHFALITRGALRTCDRITPGVIEMIEKDMLKEASDERLDSKQLFGRSKQILTQPDTSSPSSSIFSQHSMVLQSRSPTQPHNSTGSTSNQQRQVFGRQVLHQTPSRSRRQYTSNSMANSRHISPITLGYPFEEPETMSTYSQDNYDSGLHENFDRSMSNPTQQGNRRPASHQRPLVDQPKIRSPYDARVMNETRRLQDSEGHLMDPEIPSHSTVGMTARSKGKDPVRNSRRSTEQQSRNLYSTASIQRMVEEDYMGNEVHRAATEDGDLYAGGYSQAGEVVRRQSRRDTQPESPSHMGGNTSKSNRVTTPGINRSSSNQIFAANSKHSPDFVPQTTQANQSKRQIAASKLPDLPLITALKWRDQERENSEKWNKLRGRKREDVKLPGKHLLGRVGKRDHVFIIDDAETMRGYWDEVCELFGILSWFVKPSDEDGIELYFTMADEVFKSKKTRKLVDNVRKHKEHLAGSSNINVCLGKVLNDYEQQLTREREFRKANSHSARADDLKPLTVYVFTNGLWSENTDPTQAIKSLVESLVKYRYRPSQVGIQFISFGNDPVALANLNRYDDNLNLEMDIVDHTPSYANLWKMLLGAIDEEFD